MRQLRILTIAVVCIRVCNIFSSALADFRVAACELTRFIDEVMSRLRQKRCTMGDIYFHWEGKRHTISLDVDKVKLDADELGKSWTGYECARLQACRDATTGVTSEGGYTTVGSVIAMMMHAGDRSFHSKGIRKYHSTAFTTIGCQLMITIAKVVDHHLGVILSLKRAHDGRIFTSAKKFRCLNPTATGPPHFRALTHLLFIWYSW